MITSLLSREASVFFISEQRRVAGLLISALWVYIWRGRKTQESTEYHGNTINQACDALYINYLLKMFEIYKMARKIREVCCVSDLKCNSL